MFFVIGGSAMTVSLTNNTIDGGYGSGGTIEDYGVELNCDDTHPMNFSAQYNTIHGNTYSGYWIGPGLCYALLQNENIYNNQGSGLVLYTPAGSGTYVSMKSVDSENNPYNSGIGWSGYGVYFATSSTSQICIDTASNVTTGNGLGAFGNLSYTQQSSCPASLP